MMRKIVYTAFLLIFTLSFLSACGGSSGSGGDGKKQPKNGVEILDQGIQN